MSITSDEAIDIALRHHLTLDDAVAIQKLAANLDDAERLVRKYVLEENTSDE